MMNPRIPVIVALATQLACYSYRPATLETAPDGAHVRVLITPEAERQLLATFGVQEGRTLSGRLEGRAGDDLNLMVPSVPMGFGAGSRPLYQRVVLPAADVLRVDVRRLDVFRTGVLAAGAAAVAGMAVLESLGEGFFSGGPPGSPPAERVQGWKIRLSIPWP